MHFFASRSRVRLVAVSLTAMVLLLTYQNCAGNYQTQNQAEPEQYYHAMEEVTENPEREITSAPPDPMAVSKLSNGNECSVENLRCVRKVYSPIVENKSYTEKLCASDVCLDVATHSYDTRPAIGDCTDCGPEVARPGGAFNREEVTCWMGEPGSASVYALRGNLDDAVASAVATCVGSAP